MSGFLQITEGWRRQHPGAASGVLGVSGIVPAKSIPDLENATNKVEQTLARNYPDRAAIKADPRVQAYGAYYKRFKKTYQVASQLESVALKGRSIPRFLPLVQAMFTAELKNLILTAGHDQTKIHGPVRLMAASGEESFVKMGGAEQKIKAGDMYMCDDEGLISDVIYGPDERTKITASSASVLFAVYAPPGITPEDLQSHLEDIESYCRLITPESLTDFLEVHSA